ncbi:MAG: histidine phosphatase family protein [Planctomycetota bacterium]
MRLYIVRHGKAERSSDSGRDQDRDLRARGHRQAEFIAESLAADEHVPGLIVTSRFNRAFDTARAIQHAVGCPLHTDPLLETDLPVSNAVTVVQRVATRGDVRALAIVGHNNQLTEFVAMLGSGHNDVDGHYLRTGEAAVFDVLDPDALPTAASATFRAFLRLDDGEGD